MVDKSKVEVVKLISPLFAKAVVEVEKSKIEVKVVTKLMLLLVCITVWSSLVVLDKLDELIRAWVSLALCRRAELESGL